MISLNIAGQGPSDSAMARAASSLRHPANVSAGGLRELRRRGRRCEYGDKFADVAIAGFAPTVSIFSTGRGNGTFDAATLIPTVSQPVGVIFTDANKDSRLDLLVGNQGGTAVGNYLGKNSGTLHTGISADNRHQPPLHAARRYRWNGDGLHFLERRLEQRLLAFGNGTIHQQYHAGLRRPGMGPFSVAAGDFNRDGTSDVVTANIISNDLSVLLRAVQITLSRSAAILHSRTCNAVAVLGTACIQKNPALYRCSTGRCALGTTAWSSGSAAIRRHPGQPCVPYAPRQDQRPDSCRCPYRTKPYSPPTGFLDGEENFRLVAAVGCDKVATGSRRCGIPVNFIPCHVCAAMGR